MDFMVSEGIDDLLDLQHLQKNLLVDRWKWFEGNNFMWAVGKVTRNYRSHEGSTITCNLRSRCAGNSYIYIICVLRIYKYIVYTFQATITYPD